MDAEAKAWLNLTTENANDATLWFERDLDDFLKEIHREDEEVDVAKVEEEEEHLKQLLSMANRKWIQLAKLMENFDKWEFDMHGYHEVLGQDIVMKHFGIKLF